MTRTAISPRFAIRIFFTSPALYSTGAGRRRRRTAMVRGLFVGVGELEQGRLAPRTAEELQAGGQRVAARVAHRHGDRREAGARREQLAVVAAGRIQVADQARRVAPGRVDERVELQRRPSASGPPAAVSRGTLRAPCTRPLARHIVGRLSAFEPRLDRRVKTARLDDLLERVHRRLVAEAARGIG